MRFYFSLDKKSISILNYSLIELIAWDRSTVRVNVKWFHRTYLEICFSIFVKTAISNKEIAWIYKNYLCILEIANWSSEKEEKLKKLTRREAKLWQRRQWVSVVAWPQPHRRRSGRRRRAPKARAPSSWGSRHSISMCSRCVVRLPVDCPRVAVAAADSAIAEPSRLQRLWLRRRISGWRRPTAETATEAMVAAADTWPPALRARSRKWSLCRGCT